MKIALKINACIIILFASILTFFNYRNDDTLHWHDWGQSTNSQKIYLKNTGIAGSDLYSLLTTLADEVGINIIKTDYLNLENAETIIKSIYMGDSTDIILQPKDMLSGNVLTQEDNHNNYFLSSKEISDSLCKGRIFDFLNDNDVEIWTLHRLMSERGSLDGDYIIRSSNRQSILNFIEELSKRSGISIDQLTTQKTFVVITRATIELISIIGIIASLLVFALLCIFYGANSSKKIGVMKLAGFKNIHIWNELIFNILSFIIMFTIVLDILYLWILENNTIDFMFSLIKIEILMLLLVLVTSSLIYWIIKRNKISNLVKNKQPIKHLIKLTYGIKYFILFILVFLSMCMGAGLKLASDEYQKMKHWETVGEWGVLVDMNIGDDSASIRQGSTVLDKDFAEFYSYLNAQGAIYARVSEFSPHVCFKTKYNEQTGGYGYEDYFDSTIVPQSYMLTTFNINPNYLKTYPILDINGETISVGETEERVILVPESKQSEAKIIEELYKADYIRSLKSVERRHGIENDEVPDVQIRSIIYKEDKNGYFSFSTDYKDQNYIVHHPIFEVLTENNMTLWEKSAIKEQGINAPLKVNLQNKTSEEFNSELPSITANYRLDDNNLKYMSIQEVFTSEINQIKTACKQYIIGLIFMFIVMILITGYLSKLLIQAKKQKYCIQKLYGYSFIDRYQSLLLVSVIINFVIAILAVVLGPQIIQMEYSVFSIFIVIVLLCLDVLSVVVLIKRYENKSVSQMVKGE